VARADSPRDTLASFLRLGAEFQAAVAAYEKKRDRRHAERVAFIGEQWLSLIDLSQVPAASRREIAGETGGYLLDIFTRIAPPALSDVPDASAFAGDGPASYVLPGTPFRIVRLADGPHQGEFLFSARTVLSAPRFYREIEHLPLRAPSPVSSWSTEIRQLTGPMVPAALVKAVPDSLKQPLFGTPIWKIIAVVLATLLMTLLLIVWHRAVTVREQNDQPGVLWRRLLSPLAIVLIAFGLHYIFALQINVAGEFAVAVNATLTLLLYLAAAWGLWVLILASFETAIDRRDFPEANLDANMLRLFARIIGIVGVVVVLAYGAQELGLPVFSLLAGLGIGGLAIALAIRPTLENLIGGFILYLDKPIRVGDYCSFGDRSGTVESIGVRSTQIRALDRTLISVPNAQFADMQIINWARCDQMLIAQTIGLRYETDTDQLRYVLATIREMFHGHPRIDSDTVRVRFAGYGASSLDIDIRVYAMTREWNDFFAVQEDVLFRVKEIVEQSGTGFALPSQTLYLGRDDGLDAERSEKAKQEVSRWRRAQQLPFPRFAASRLKQLDDRLSYPPPGSPDFNATAEELAEGGEERLSAEPAEGPSVGSEADASNTEETDRK